ncbi:MAG: DMT family transporter [Planctomycetales bacterium]
MNGAKGHPDAAAGENSNENVFSSGPRPYLWMLCGAVAFALMGASAHSLADDCDWQVIAVARAAIPLAVASWMARLGKVRLVFWGPRTLWVRSIAGSISMIVTFFALTRLPVSEVLTLSNLYPIWVAVLSWPLLRLAPTADVWVATAAGVAGVYLIQQPHFAQGNYASLAALSGSLFSALAMLGLHRLHALDARAIVVHFSFVSLICALAALVVFDRSVPVSAAWQGMAPLRLVAVGGFATIGQFFLTKAFTSGPPAKVSVVGLTQVGFGALLDVMLWQRSFTPQTLGGMALVIAPTVWLLWHRK